ncbi:MAG: hypothetical protein LBU42_00575 [Prevotellaceae bacterium]|jgi:hypothetical protein|nr:hypothetical protein [Prevotellaceae bacterium]
MKTTFFFFAMFASMAASAQVTNVEPLGANYTDKTVLFRVWWNNGSRNDTHLSKVWVWVDYISVNSDNTTSGNSWTRAAVSAASPTASVTYDGTNRKGFWLQGNSGSYSVTVTVKLDITASKFNWCAYVSDYPPNMVMDEQVYYFKGTPPFILKEANGTVHEITQTSMPKANLTFVPVSITDKTECPGGLKEVIGTCAYTGTDWYADPEHKCQQRPSGAQNWEAWIKDVRDNHLYRIVQMPTNTWWMAEDLMWDGQPNPTATGYTIRGTDRSCGAHYGCGRFYDATPTGAGAVSGIANTRRESDICPLGWVLPSVDELCPYVTSKDNPHPYLGSDEFGGPDSYGLSLWICNTHYYTCGTTSITYVGGSGYAYNFLREKYQDHCGDDADWNGCRNVRCIRN